jgi:O-antigen/teichoic acid export membrane protein
MSSKSMIKGGVALIDQMLISGVNFFIAFFLARNLPESEFGTISIILLFLVFLNNVQTAIITQPHNVLGASKYNKNNIEFKVYTTTTLISQVAFALALLLCALFVGFFEYGLNNNILGTAILVLGPAVFTRQFQEYARRVLFTNGDVISVFINDLISYGGLLVGVIIIWLYDVLTISNILLLIFLTSLLGSILGGYQLRKFIVVTLSILDIKKYLLSNLKFGGWLLAGVLVSWAGTQLYPVILAGMAGIEATAAFFACLNIVKLMNPLMFTITSYVTPIAAKAADTGKTELNKIIAKTVLLCMPIVIVSTIVISSMPEQLLNLLYATKYQGYGNLLRMLALSIILIFSANILQLGLRSLHLTKEIFLGFLVSGIVTFTLGIYMIDMFGIIGAASGLLISWLSSILIFSYFYYRSQ